MTTYYIKKYGMHELHQGNCVWLPIRKGMVELGNFDTDEEAFNRAQTRYDKVIPCPACCNVGKKKSISTAKS